MSSCVILKEDQSGCQPWELTNFDTHSSSVTNASAAGITLPTIEKIAAIEEQARQEGYDAGHAEGREQGLAEGREAAARETDRLRTLADTFSTELRTADESISEQVLDLSLDVAHALLKTSLTINPELVIHIIREAVRYLPALHQPAMLYLKPGDMMLVQDKIGDELTKTGWQIASDTQLEPGGCRVETSHNEIDASISTRWQRLTTALGKDSSWLVA